MTEWELPEGYWVWDVSHFPRPATGFLRALPAVIGAAGLLARITDAHTITVDPDGGRVRDH